MKDISEEVQAKLNTVLPTCYELFLSPDTIPPCISYQITNNSIESNGNTACYERIVLRIKLWVNTVSDMCLYSARIDDALAELGPFQRNTSYEMVQGSLLCRVFDYSIIIAEKYNTVRYL